MYYYFLTGMSELFILSHRKVWVSTRAQAKARKVDSAGVTPWVLACYKSSGPYQNWGWGGGNSPYGFHSCFSIFSRLKLEHSRLIYESLWISVLKQLQPGFLFFSFPDFCWISSSAGPVGLIKKLCCICILKFDLEVRFLNAKRKKMRARTTCCKLIIFIYIYLLAIMQEENLLSVM